ncbi:MAG: aminopeptidase P family protein [Elusimicrobia bacterium]|nr:aminopeptidase P family protein [Elusimicrobiota bacterium]
MNPLKALLYRGKKGRTLDREVLEGLARSQDLAYRCAKAIAREMREGWSEAQTARLMDVWLADHGVRVFFHKSFAWFGERSRFDGMRRWADFLPGKRALGSGDCVILDTAPVFKGYPGDIGYSFSLGPDPELGKAAAVLEELRATVLRLFEQAVKNPGRTTGGDIASAIARHIAAAGYEPAHHKYPGGVLGHRLHPMPESRRPPTFIPFSWQALSRFLREGLLPDLLNEEHRGELWGAWAIEPHLGGKGFGAKFEEILVVEETGVRWLSEEIPWR